MSDFMSDLNNLTQSAGNALNSVTRLYEVRTNLESQRISSEIQKKNYDFIMRTKLPAGDQNRITAENWRPELDRLNSEANDLVNSTKWDSVKGAVSRAVEPINHQFQMQMADAYAAQEIEAGQSDFMRKFELDASMADTPEKMNAVVSSALDFQKNMGLFSTADFNSKVRPRLDEASGRALFQAATSDTPAIEPKLGADGVTMDAGVDAVPADFNSAMKAIEESDVEYGAKSVATAQLRAYSKQQTESLADFGKKMLTEPAKDGTVDVPLVEATIAQARFADPNTVNGLKAELKGYEYKQKAAPMDMISGGYYTKYSKEQRSSLSKEALGKLSAYISKPENAEWARSTKGQEAIEAKQQEIASWELLGEEKASASKDIYRLYGDLIPITNALSMADPNLVQAMTGILAIQREATRLNNLDPSAAGVSFLKDTSKAFDDANRQIQDVYGLNVKNALGVPNEAMAHFLDSMTPKQQKEFLEGTANMDPKLALFYNQANDLMISAMTSLDNPTQAQKDATIIRVTATMKDLYSNAMSGKTAEGETSGVFTPAEEKVAKDLVTWQENGMAAKVVSVITGESTATPGTEGIIKQADQWAQKFIDEKLKASGTTVRVGTDKNGFPTYGVYRSVPGAPNGVSPTPITYSITGVKEGKNTRLALTAPGADTIFLDGKPAQAKQDKAKAEQLAKEREEDLRNARAAQAAIK